MVSVDSIEKISNRKLSDYNIIIPDKDKKIINYVLLAKFEGYKKEKKKLIKK